MLREENSLAIRGAVFGGRDRANGSRGHHRRLVRRRRPRAASENYFRKRLVRHYGGAEFAGLLHLRRAFEHSRADAGCRIARAGGAIHPQIFGVQPGLALCYPSTRSANNTVNINCAGIGLGLSSCPLSNPRKSQRSGQGCRPPELGSAFRRSTDGSHRGFAEPRDAEVQLGGILHAGGWRESARAACWGIIGER